MIKFERVDTPRARAAAASLAKAKASNKSYNTSEVNEALEEMFYGKCYICENKGITSFQIEHLRPHRGDRDLKYDWNNLFLACAHCNQIKGDRFDPIVDCSRTDVERKIAFRKEGYFGEDEKYEFTILEDSEEIRNTVGLLRAAYYGDTPQKKMEAVRIRRALRRDLSDFKNLVREYEEAKGQEREDLRCAIRKELEPGAAFTAFKRWLLWDNEEKYITLLREI